MSHRMMDVFSLRRCILRRYLSVPMALITTVTGKWMRPSCGPSPNRFHSEPAFLHLAILYRRRLCSSRVLHFRRILFQLVRGALIHAAIARITVTPGK